MLIKLIIFSNAQIIWTIMNHDNPIIAIGLIILNVISSLLSLFKDLNKLVLYSYWISVLILIMLSIMEGDIISLLFAILSI